MSILAIGQSSFLAQETKKQKISKDWNFLSHRDSLHLENWPEEVKTVIAFACDPKVRGGEFSDFDHRLAEMAKEVGAAYIMLSSRTVYGVASVAETFVEDQVPHSEMTPYGMAKRQIEDDLLESFDHVTILRLSNIFGFEYEQGSARCSFFGIMLKSLKEEGRITLNMAAETERDFLPVSVFAECLGVIAQNPKAGIFNLGSGIGSAVGDMAKWVIEGYGSGEVVHSEDKVIDSFILDMSETRMAYPVSSFDKGIIQQHCVDVAQKLQSNY